MEDRILVTGSTGFVGRALIASLSARKLKVSAFIRDGSSESLIPQGTCHCESVEAIKRALRRAVILFPSFCPLSTCFAYHPRVFVL